MEVTETAPLDLVWGVDGIAKLIGRSPRQTYHMLYTDKLPARRVGGRWVAERSKLLAFFTGEAA